MNYYNKIRKRIKIQQTQNKKHGNLKSVLNTVVEKHYHLKKHVMSNVHTQTSLII